jgi:hypothetical protein
MALGVIRRQQIKQVSMCAARVVRLQGYNIAAPPTSLLAYPITCLQLLAHAVT